MNLGLQLRPFSLMFCIAAAAAVFEVRHALRGSSIPPLPPPAAARTAEPPVVPCRTIGVVIEYDAEFRSHHGDGAEDFIARAMGLMNMEWQQLRREWFTIEELRERPSGDERDASHVLARFLFSTAGRASTIHIRIVGRQLEVYSDGRSALSIGGLAFRGSDVAVVSAPARVTVELLAYYLFHEIGHLWEAHDIPFRGGESTFGDKSRYSFDVDAGNAVVIEESAGPAPRDRAHFAPAILRRRLAEARRITRDPVLLARVHDLLLHEGSPSNPAWVAKKKAFLDEVPDERLRRLVSDHEITPRERSEESDVRRELARHYWRANDALARNDLALAESEMAAMRTLQQSEANENVRILVGAVERKLRKYGR